MDKNLVCRVCGEESIKVNNLYRERFNTRIYLYKCGGCNSVYIEPVATQGETMSSYNTAYYRKPLIGKLISLVNKVDLYKDIRFIEKILKNRKNVRVLDIGCGSGEFSELLDKSFYCYGVDGSKEAIDLASRAHANRVGGWDYSIVNLFEVSEVSEVSDKKFDLIILRNIVEHFVIYEKLLSIAASNLADNGIVFIRAPNPESKMLHRYQLNWYMFDDPTHVNFVSLNVLENKCKHYGLSLYKKTFVSSGLLAHYRSQGRTIFSFLSNIFLFLRDFFFNSQSEYTVVFIKKHF